MTITATTTEERPRIGRGILAMGGAQIINHVLRVLTLIVLARMLLPEAMGVVSVVILIADILWLVSEMGIGTAIVQRNPLTDAYLSTAFWVATILAVVIVLTLVLLTPAVALLFALPELTPYIRAIALSSLLAAPGIVPAGLLNRDLRFPQIATVESSAMLAFGITAISIALAGWGVWAIVAAYYARLLVRTSGVWLLARWQPQLAFSRAELGHLLNFGGNATGGQVLNFVASNLDYLLVSRFLGAAALGIYTTAYTVGTNALIRQATFLYRVFYPVYARSQDNHAYLLRLHMRVMTVIGIIFFPLSLSLAVLAEPIVLAFFGIAWQAMIVPFAILSITGAALIHGQFAGALMLAQGRPDISLWLVFVRAALIVGLGALGVPWGVSGVALGVFVAAIVMQLIVQYYSLRLIGAGLHRYVACLLPGLAVAGLVVVLLGGWLWLAAQLSIPSFGILLGAVPAYLLAMLLAALLGLLDPLVVVLGSRLGGVLPRLPMPVQHRVRRILAQHEEPPA